MFYDSIGFAKRASKLGSSSWFRIVELAEAFFDRIAGEDFLDSAYALRDYGVTCPPTRCAATA